MPITKEILDMLDLGRKAIASNFILFFTSKIQQLQRISVPLGNGFRLFLLMAIDGPIAKNHRSVGTPLYISQYRGQEHSYPNLPFLMFAVYSHHQRLFPLYEMLRSPKVRGRGHPNARLPPPLPGSVALSHSLAKLLCDQGNVQKMVCSYNAQLTLVSCTTVQTQNS